MKFECLKEKLLPALLKAERITSKNPSLAVLSCVIIGASGNQVVIKSTNLELGLEITLPAKIEEEGVIALIPGPFIAFISNLSSEKNISISTNDKGILSISCGGHKATLKTEKYDEFPNIPESAEKEVSVNIESFIEGIQSVWYSASISSIKPELSSIYIYNDKEYIVFAATDSFRLAEKRIKIKKSIEDLHVLIPYKNIPEIVKILEGVGGDVKISTDRNQISFNSPNLYLTSRVIDGVFPDYKKIIPAGSTTEIILLKSELVEALRIVRVFSDKFNQISLSVSSPKGICEFTSKNSDIGEGTYVLKVKIKGESVNLNFNHKYLFDCIQSIPTESVIFKFNGQGKALVIEGYNDNTFTYLVMPNR